MMNLKSAMLFMALPFVGGAAILGDGATQAQTACKPFKVNVPILQVRKFADKPGVYLTALQKGEIACIGTQPTVGSQKFGYVVHKTANGGPPIKVDGWASTIFMSPQSTAATPPPQQQKPQPNVAAATPKTKAPAAEDILHFDQPVPYGAPQVRGKTLKELVEGRPMFAPIENLPERLWKKNCASCHKWDAKTLCEQGRSYLSKAAEVFRHQHPYGGAYKLSLMRWAKTGCN
jgi:hypothetical protein